MYIWYEFALKTHLNTLTRSKIGMLTIKRSFLSGVKSAHPVTLSRVATPSVRTIMRGKKLTPWSIGIVTSKTV